MTEATITDVKTQVEAAIWYVNVIAQTGGPDKALRAAAEDADRVWKAVADVDNERVYDVRTRRVAAIVHQMFADMALSNKDPARVARTIAVSSALLLEAVSCMDGVLDPACDETTHWT